MQITAEQVNAVMKEIMVYGEHNPGSLYGEDAPTVMRQLKEARGFRALAVATALETMLRLITANGQEGVAKAKTDPMAIGDPLLQPLSVAFYAGLKLGQKEAETAILKSWEQTQKAS